MPGFDGGTGPQGMGPMTGGGRGFCAAPATGVRRFLRGRRFFGFGRGFFGRGRGGGGGRGYRNRFYATGVPGWAGTDYGYYDQDIYGQEIPAKEELQMLQEESDMLKKQLEDIQKRVNELNANSEK